MPRPTERLAPPNSNPSPFGDDISRSLSTVMERSLTLNGPTSARALSFLAGAGMIVASALTIDHYFSANFPETIWEGSFCDINAFFNCDSSSYSLISQVGGVPLGYFGVVVGVLVSLGALFPSRAFERTNKTIALLNGVGVVALFAYSVFVLGSLCLLCSGYYVFALLSLLLFWRFGIDGDEAQLPRRWIRPSSRHLAVFAVFTAAGAFGFIRFHDAKEDAQTGGVASRIVEEYFELPEVPLPSVLSPYWTIRSGDEFQDAPVRIVEYGDLLCPDCRYLAEQLHRLEEEFPGKVNAVFQFFPLEGECNDVVEKDLHPGACELSYMAAHDPASFRAIHDEIWETWPSARDPEWRMDMARRYGVSQGPEDPETREMVHRLIQTGKEYEKTSEQYAYGIRSTPTTILNGRMLIGTLPYEQLKAIVEAIISRSEGGDRFLESWVER